MYKTFMYLRIWLINMYARIIITVIVLFSCFQVSYAAEKAKDVDHGIYADLLARHVHQGFVNYGGFKKDEGMLDEYLRVLEKTDPDILERNERFAFYINAYNAWTIKLILSAYPDVISIKDLGTLFQSPWKKKICRINNKELSLDDIEHGILRPQFKDPRVHFAINCASKGCPALRSYPYTGKDLDGQLDESARSFINNPEKNRIADKTLYISSIFKWFSEDFRDGTVNFVLRYASDGMKSKIIKAGASLETEYLDYDWTLNGK